VNGAFDTARATPHVLAWTFALVFLAALGALELTHYTGRIAAIWIGNAILLAILFRHPRSEWGKLLLAGCFANFVADTLVGDSLLQSLTLSFCNAVEVITIAWPMRRLRMDSHFTRPYSLLAFYILSGGIGPALAGTLAAVYFSLANGADFLTSMEHWYAADALGLVILAPLLITVRLKDFREIFGRAQVSVTVQLIGLVCGAVAANFVFKGYPVAFLFFPAVVLLTFQRGFAGGAIGMVIAAAYLATPVLMGDASGGLKGHPLREQIILVQIFVAVTGFSVTLVGAALQQRRRLERDIADAMERAEMAREEALVARDAAEKASRAKSMFLANMSHELRTPLNAVIGFAELMHAQTYGPLGDPHYRDYAEMIQGAGRHLLDLINDILDMSKIEAGKLELDRERIVTAALVGDCMALMSERAHQGEIEFSSDLSGAPAVFLADRRAMKQILLNLLSNAIKFTPAGGKVAVRAKANNGVLTLSVSDTGVGIPSDQVYRLGNPFVQIRASAGASQNGTGLGLALVRALTELHGGALKIDSVQGAGTTVNVELPLAEAESLAA
jgi:signal transduction histidine kinase